MKRLGFALFVTLLPLSLHGQDAAPSAPRPLYSTSAGLTAPGTLELEWGGQATSSRDGSTSRTVPTQFNLGVCNWFDVRLGWTGAVSLRGAGGPERHGWGDPQVGGQGLFATQAQAGLDLGFAFWHKFPRASVARGIGTGRHDDQLALTGSRVQGRWELDVNAGANGLGNPATGGRVYQPLASCCVTYAAAPGWNVTLDTYALGGTVQGPRIVSTILAVSRTVSESLTVDAAVESGLTQAAPRIALNLGLVWRIGRLWSTK